MNHSEYLSPIMIALVPCQSLARVAVSTHLVGTDWAASGSGCHWKILEASIKPVRNHCVNPRGRSRKPNMRGETERTRALHGGAPQSRALLASADLMVLWTELSALVSSEPVDYK